MAVSELLTHTPWGTLLTRIQYLCSFFYLQAYRLHQLSKLFRSAPFPTPFSEIVSYIYNTIRFSYHSLYSSIISLTSQMIFLICIRCFTLYVVKFYGFQKIHNVMYPPLQYHTEQFIALKIPYVPSIHPSPPPLECLVTTDFFYYLCTFIFYMSYNWNQTV